MKYTGQEQNWLMVNYPKLGVTEATRQFNVTFGHSQKSQTISAYCSRKLGLKVNNAVTSELLSKNHNVTCRNVTARRFYEEREKQWLIENYPKLGIKETTRQFNEKFNHNKDCRAVKRYCSQWLGLTVPKETTKQIKNHPVGYIRRNRQGVWYIKTETGWELLTHTILEVPKGHLAFHLDGNGDNNSPENLVVVRNGIQTIARNNNLVSENPTITSVGITWSELYSELKKKGVIRG